MPNNGLKNIFMLSRFILISREIKKNIIINKYMASYLFALIINIIIIHQTSDSGIYLLDRYENHQNEYCNGNFRMNYLLELLIYAQMLFMSLATVYVACKIRLNYIFIFIVTPFLVTLYFLFGIIMVTNIAC